VDIELDMGEDIAADHVFRKYREYYRQRF
jgi:hypothetical protein